MNTDVQVLEQSPPKKGDPDPHDSTRLWCEKCNGYTRRCQQYVVNGPCSKCLAPECHGEIHTGICYDCR